VLIIYTYMGICKQQGRDVWKSQNKTWTWKLKVVFIYTYMGLESYNANVHTRAVLETQQKDIYIWSMGSLVNTQRPAPLLLHVRFGSLFFFSSTLFIYFNVDPMNIYTENIFVFDE
jgi:hypothetical protein